MSGIPDTNLGNDNALKFKTPEERQALCESYIQHRQRGLSKESFPDCDMQTFKRYMKDFPSDFDTDRIERVERENRMFWEELGIVGTTEGKNFNASAWKFNMQNRFRWTDRQDLTTDGEKLTTIELVSYGGNKDQTAA